jgi:hypothetical protein
VLPFEADTVEDMILKHLSTIAEPPSARAKPERGITPALDALVLQCLQKRPEDRPSSMQEVELRLNRARDEIRGPDAAVAPAPSAVGGGLWRQRPFVMALAATGALGVLAVTVLVTLMLVGHRTPPVATVTPAPSPTPVPSPGEASTPEKKGHAPTINIAFATNPSGALVRDESGRVLGITPLKIARAKAGRSNRFVFELAGFAAAIRKVSLVEDSHVSVDLMPLAGTAKAKAPAPPAKKKTGH